MYGFARSVWSEPRPPDAPVRVWRDWALVGMLVPLAVLEGVLRPDLPWRLFEVAVTVGLAPTLLWRRTRPLAMLAICFVATGVIPILVTGTTLDMYTLVYMLVLPYALFRWGSGREIVTGLGIMLAAAGLSVLVKHAAPTDVVGPFAVMLATTSLGGVFRYRAGARMRELDQVKLMMREQLARDLHDTVAHHVSAMAIRAQAGLATAASRPDAATEALRVIEAEAARALDEMRGIVRVLRRDRPAELTPGRRIAEIERLASRGGSHHPAVEVEISGDLDGLSPSVESAVYRIAQEAVTNAVRHARRATRVEVRVAADETAVRLCVRDDGGGGSARPAASPGYGIIGMSERANLLGGTCVAGPDRDRGWTVTAVLPRAGVAS
ncbi:sensor histidine kinase [Microbispora sp. GKU 823]|uniref:ATP-binding protein n=1 Tax=Microbispora sp. GKU 823 TaxID=1652100 RepID=UPI0009CF8B97|nr:sensor histidine kinase [Microbispora sp. GKU 823]OPG09638.1 two-component sensor histidine kinase [Microbispora sp. GKU 823]